MDSRTAVRGSVISKTFVGAALMLAAVGLGAGGAYAAHVLAPAAGTQAVSTSATFAAGPAFDDPGRKAGSQYVGGAPATHAVYRAPDSRLGGPRF